MEFNCPLGFYSIADLEDTGYKLYSTGGISKTTVTNSFSNLCLEPHFPTNQLMEQSCGFSSQVSVCTHML